jgi:hypothetical protein
MSLALYPSRVRSNEVLDGSPRPLFSNEGIWKPYAMVTHQTNVWHDVSLIKVADINVLHYALYCEWPTYSSSGTLGQRLCLDAGCRSYANTKVTRHREPKAAE